MTQKSAAGNYEMEEQPLVSWGNIATYLKLSIPATKKDLKKKGIKVFMLGRYVAVYPSDLRRQLAEAAQSLKQRTQKETCIYFIQAENRGIKIGITNNIQNRLKDLKASSPLELNLLGTIKGTLKKESKIHQKFKKYKIHTEWFHVDKEILAYIKRYKNG